MPAHRLRVAVEPSNTVRKQRLMPKIGIALALCVLSCACVHHDDFWDTAPVRNVAYNPYISSRLVHSNPRGNSGVVYRPTTHFRSRTVTHEEYKEVVTYSTH